MGEVLVYDGECGFCADTLRAMGVLLSHWPRVVAYQETDLAALGLTEQQCARQVYWVGDRGRRGGAAAVAELLRFQPSRGWQLLALPLVLPPTAWLGQGLYRVIARYRARLTPLVRWARDYPVPGAGR